jgi:hypothetical protein
MADPQRYLLLVNPSAGAGRARKRLPAIESELKARGMPYRIVQTTGLEHGCREAIAGVAAGEIPVAAATTSLAWSGSQPSPPRRSPSSRPTSAG